MNRLFKVVKHIEMPKAGPKKSICHFQKPEMILKWNKQNSVRLPQKYQFLLIDLSFLDKLLMFDLYNSKITFVGAWSLIRLNVKGMFL